MGKSIHAHSNPILEMSPLSEVSLLSVYAGCLVSCSGNDGRDFTGLVGICSSLASGSQITVSCRVLRN